MADETAQNNATTNDAPSNNDTNQTNNGSGSNITSQSPSVMIKLTNLIAEGRLDFAAWFIRIYLIVLSVQHIFLGGALPSVDPCYKKALIANALVACVRLHQRIGSSFALSKEHFARVSAEDSAHYLLFSLIFLMQPGKITMALVPITLMAAIHAVKYSYKFLDTLNTNTGRRLLNSIAQKQQSLFRVVASTEIFLLPVLAVMLILGRAQIFAPILYFKYLKMRYYSQRNRYSKQVFYELNMAGNMYKNNDRTPAIAKKAIEFVQNTVAKLGQP